MEEGMKAVSCSYTIFDIAAGTIEKKNAKMVDHVPLDFVAGACPPTYVAHPTRKFPSKGYLNPNTKP